MSNDNCNNKPEVSYIAFIPMSDLNPDKPFELNEKGEITKFNLKRKGTYGGKRFGRKFHKMPEFKTP